MTDRASGEAAPGAASRTTGSRALFLLLLLLLGVNAVAIWGLVSARQSARRLALEDLEWQTRAQAQALEAALASLRGDFILLTQSPPLAQAHQRLIGRLAGDDPVVRRWSRLEVEGTLLLFLTTQPAVARLVVEDSSGAVLARAGRRDGAPVLLPVDAAPGLGPGQSEVAWPLGSEEPSVGRLRAVLDGSQLLATVAPGFEDRLRLLTQLPHTAPTSHLEARATVTAEGFEPELSWTLLRSEEESRFVSSIETLTGRFGTAVVVNVVVLGLSYALALLALRQARRAARLAAENEHQARLRDLERQVQASERLASVGRLAAGLAHEINNPLEGMSNYLRLLEDDLAAGDTREAVPLAAKVRQGLERIAGITRQVLRFSHPGQAPKEAVDLAPLLARNADLLSARPEARNVHVELDLPAEPLLVWGNATTLEQLFLNLMLNACQMQPGGGRVEVKAWNNGARAHVTVADSGPGLTPEALEHAFEPFFSTRSSTGLGLSVCKGIVDDHGGAVRMSNRIQGGALFEIELPRPAVPDGGMG